MSEPRTPQSQPPLATKADDDNEISLLEILVIFAKYKWIVVALPVAAAVLAVLLSFAFPNVYTGAARLLPPQPGSSAVTAVLMGESSNLSGGVGQALGFKNPSDLYVGMLQSRTVADEIIKRFDLQNIYRLSTLVETRKALADVTDISAAKDGIITVEVQDHDAKRAADMANAYVEQLDFLNKRVTVTTAGRQRQFMEKQLRQVKDQLSDAEVALRSTQEKTGLISVTEQGRAMIESIANLRALIAAKQVQLATMGTSTTESNPDYVRTKRELTGLRAELQKLEKNDAGGTDAIIPSAGKIPGSGLEYVRKYRDVHYYQTLFELIAKQYEIAKAQEAAEGGLIQVLDAAVVADKKTKPRRLLVGILVWVFATLGGLVAAVILESRARALANPVHARLLGELERHLLHWRLPGRRTP